MYRLVLSAVLFYKFSKQPYWAKVDAGEQYIQRVLILYIRVDGFL